MARMACLACLLLAGLISSNSLPTTASEGPKSLRVTFRSGATPLDKLDFNRPHDQVSGDLYRPAGDGPFAAVVVQPDRLGLHDTHRQWAARLAIWGYVALVVDSVGSRRRTPKQHVWAHDAYGAMRYLAGLPSVDRHRIAWMGWANGGGAAMIRSAGMEADPNDPSSPQGFYSEHRALRFRAAVAWYPRCPGIAKRYYAPVLLLVNGIDAMGFDDCAATVAGSTGGGKPVRAKVYREATRFFDRPDLNLDRDGMPTHHDPAATADAIAQVKAFLDEHLRP